MLGGGLGIGLGLMVSGAVAATVLGAYGAAGVVVLRRRAQRQSQARAHRVATDAVVALAADLRAGVTTAEALAAADAALLHAADLSIAPAVDASSESVARRLASAAVVSQTTGAPLADLLERLDAHVRAVDRAHALAQTQAAGARASAVLLAAMPLAGVGLGMAMGVDPGRVLLHTTLGGTALCFAVALQLGGLAWTARLARLEART
jgi:tight adherence protein B